MPPQYQTPYEQSLQGYQSVQPQQAAPGNSFQITPKNAYDIFKGVTGKGAVSSAAPSTYGGLPVGTPVASGVDGSIIGAGPAAEVPGAFSMSGIGSAGNAILPAAGALGALNLTMAQGDAPRGNYLRGIGQGAASGAAMGSYFGPWGTGIGAGIGGLLGGIGAATGSGKDKYQMARDQGRRAVQNAGFADSNYMTKLADGSTFDIGLDGGQMYDNMGKNIDGNTKRHAYDVDFSNELAKNLIPRVDAQVRQILGPNASAKQMSDLTGQLINGITSNAKDQNTVDANFASVFNQPIPKSYKIPVAKPPQVNQATLPNNVTPVGIPNKKTLNFKKI